MLESGGVRNVQRLWIANAIAVELTKTQLDNLASRPDVAHIRLDVTLAVPAAAEEETAAPNETPWNVNAVNAPALWALGHTGRGMVVASLDTGVDGDHPDLKPRWRGGTNSWFDPRGEYKRPTDLLGHGTQVLGTIVGGGGSGKAIGVAPGAQWIAAKIFDDAGTASLSAIHRALQWVIDPDGDPSTDDAPDVVSNAWVLESEAGQCDREFERDVQALKAAGIAVVFAAGNFGSASGNSVSPANYAESLAVGAVTRDGATAAFSARGWSDCDGRAYPDLLAPGVDVPTTDLSVGGLIPNPYTVSTGTSFAVSHVAGALLLLQGALPEVPMLSIERALTSTASRGAINVEAAYLLLGGEAQQRPPPLREGFAVARDERAHGCATSLGNGWAVLTAMIWWLRKITNVRLTNPMPIHPTPQTRPKAWETTCACGKLATGDSSHCSS